MTKLEIQAIRHLPKRYVRDGTSICSVSVIKGIVVLAINPALPLIRYAYRDKKWVRVKLVPATINPQSTSYARQISLPIIP